MAEFVFFGDTSDSTAIASSVLGDPSLKLLRAWEYPSRKAEQIDRNLSNFGSSIAANKGMYVTGPFTAKIPWLRNVGADEDCAYSIDDSSGDLISIRFPGMSAKNGAMIFNAGSVHIQSQYLTRDRRGVKPPSDALRAGYRNVVRLVRKCCVKVRYNGRPSWIGAHLLARGRNDATVSLRLYGKCVLVADLEVDGS